MALAVGTRLGSYEVLGRIGAGGMGEVFRARDTKLGREVALKVLPDAVAGLPDRRARLEREAHLLASLSHPHIAAIHGLVETDDGLPVLALELVEGEALDARIARGMLPLRETLVLAGQIAEALEAAHEKGILHRDLKPSNVKLTREGKAKLLDFGLAKVVEAEEREAGRGPVLSAVATLAKPEDATGAGAVLGTAPYMSPEQARGEGLDKRTDVWAFGCVLFEMLSGTRAFPGATPTEAIAAVLEREPAWGVLPEGTPVKVSDLLRRCLRKDKTDRLRDIADARIELAEALSETTSGAMRVAPSRAPGRRRVRLLAGGLVAALLGGLLTWIWLRPVPSSSKARNRLTVPLPPGVSLPGVNAPPPLALSPEGSRLVFAGDSAKGRQLYLRDLGAIEAKPIPGTEGASQPFFSPDGRWLGFVQDTKLKKLLLEGGPPLPICEVGVMRGATWGTDDTIVFTPRSGGGLWRVSASGGPERQLTATDTVHRWPQILPIGRAAVFTEGNGRTAVVSLETGQWRVVLEGGYCARYLSSGHLLYGRDGALLAAPFDLKLLQVIGAAIPVLDDVRMDRLMSSVHFDACRAGSLAYVPGYPRPVDRSLFWVDRQGGRRPVLETRGPYAQLALSPDGKRLAVTREEARSTDLWVLDLASETWRRLASGTDIGSGTDIVNPVWSPDGTRLAFASNNLYWMPADGSGAPERLNTSQVRQTPSDWSPDGGLLAFTQQDPQTWQDIWVLPLEGERKPRPFLATPHWESTAVFSPDGHWIAYISNEEGTFEIYVRPFPGPGPKCQVSRGGGDDPIWARNGREIFYRAGGKHPKLMSVAVEVGATFRTGAPRPLFDDPYRLSVIDYAISLDGQRFLMIEQPEEDSSPNQIVVIPDFAAELKQKLRAAKR